MYARRDIELNNGLNRLHESHYPRTAGYIDRCTSQQWYLHNQEERPVLLYPYGRTDGMTEIRHPGYPDVTLDIYFSPYWYESDTCVIFRVDVIMGFGGIRITVII